MKKSLAKLCLILVVFSMIAPIFAQAQSNSEPARQITVLADFSDRGQFEVENRLFLALEKLNLGNPNVVNTGQADGQALLKRWNLKPQDLPVLALTGAPDEESAPVLLWYWRVESVPAAIQALRAEMGLETQAALPVIRAADFSPKGVPLQAGQTVKLMLQGTSGCTATAEVGGAQNISLFEMESGLYQGEYTVQADDRTDAGITLKLTADSGTSVSRFVGHVLLQGFQAPNLQSIREVSPGEWLLTGTAPPNSLVSVEAMVTQTLIFKFRTKLDFQGSADANGQFQLRANTQDNVAGSTGNFTATATLGEATETVVQRLKFQGQPRTFQPHHPNNFDFTPWSLAGRWFHFNKPVNIRVRGFDTVVIRNEHGQETTMVVVQPNRLVSRNGQLSGRVNGDTIMWNNGTMWRRTFR